MSDLSDLAGEQLQNWLTRKPDFVLDNPTDPYAPRVCPHCFLTMYLLDEICFQEKCESCSEKLNPEHPRMLEMRNAYIRCLQKKDMKTIPASS